MRASSFSNAAVIDLLNSSFVPVHLRNQDFGESGSASPGERAEKERIYREALEAGMHAGSVCVYLIAPDGHPVAAAPLNEPVAADPKRLTELMQKTLADLQTTTGEALVAPKPAAPPAMDEDSRALHVVGRYLERQGTELRPFDVKTLLGTTQGVGWASVPADSWIVLTKDEWTSLLPAKTSARGAVWDLPPAVLSKVLDQLYPPTENTDVRKNRIERQSVRAELEEIDGNIGRVQLEGSFKMKHPFYHEDDQNYVEADLHGYLEFDISARTLRALRLVTDRATYGGNATGVQPFGASVSLMD